MYLVATIIQNAPNGNDLFGEIVLITNDEQKARTLKYTIKERRPHPGLDYTKMIAFDDVIYFQMEPDKILEHTSQLPSV